MLLEEMTTDEVAAGLKKSQTVIIPYGVLEAHGPHLPLSTDTIQAYDAAKRAAELTPVFVAAPVPYGICRSLAGHPGTIGVTGDTVRSLTRDIVQSMYDMGWRNFILYSGHASALQMLALEEASEALLRTCPQANIALVLEYDVLKSRMTGIVETPGDMHAGEIETSRLLTARPDLVRTDRLPEESYRKSSKPMLVRDVVRYWPSSVEGAPRKASVEKGEQLGQIAAEYLAGLVKQMNEFTPH
ncbi:MAG: creatininase family protein [Pirellulales bacterium]|nr:creatininase family protein [Pirellulales bacterium]